MIMMMWGPMKDGVRWMIHWHAFSRSDTQAKTKQTDGSNAQMTGWIAAEARGSAFLPHFISRVLYYWFCIITTQ